MIGDQRKFAGWYDTELEVDCGFSHLEAGYWCLPRSITLGYADSSCTHPLFIGSEETEPGVYSIVQASEEYCLPDHGADVVRTGDRVARPVQYYSGTGCSPRETTLGDHIFEVGERLGLEAVVQAEPVRVSVDDRLERTLLVGSDGSETPSTLYDTQLETPVRSLKGAYVPVASPVDSGYSDASCESPLPTRFVWNQCGAAFAMDYGVPNGDACSTGVDFYRVGPKVTGTVYSDESSGCTSYTDAVSELGELVAWSAFVANEDKQFGERRIRRIMGTSAESGALLEHNGWYDTRWEVACSPRRRDDGVTRCYPSGGPGLTSARDVFGDPLCKQPIATASDCAPNPHLVEDWRNGRYFSILGEQDLPQTFHLTDDVCVVYSNTPTRAYLLSDAIDPSEFVEARDVTSSVQRG